MTLPRRAELDALVPVVYDELRKIARAQLRSERTDHSLQIELSALEKVRSP